MLEKRSVVFLSAPPPTAAVLQVALVLRSGQCWDTWGPGPPHQRDTSHSAPRPLQGGCLSSPHRKYSTFYDKSG